MAPKSSKRRCDRQSLRTLDVVGIPNCGSDIVLGSLADGKVIVIGDQPPQSLQHPEEDSSFSAINFQQETGHQTDPQAYLWWSE